MTDEVFLSLDAYTLETVVSHLHPKQVFFLSLTSKNTRNILKRNALGSFICEYVAARDVTLFSEVIHAAYMSNDSNILEWMYRHEGETVLDGHFCGTAAAYDCRRSLSWYRRKGRSLDARACNEAARKGNLQTLLWLRKEGWPWDKTTGEAAVDGGHEQMLTYLINYFELFDAAACQTAAEKGDLETLAWLRHNRVDWDGNTVYEAARLKKKEIVSWAKTNGCPLDRHVVTGIREAVIHEDIDTLCLLHEYGYCVEERPIMCRIAAMYDKMRVLTWAIHENFACDALVCANAAGNGNLEMLRWLHDKGYQWDFRVVTRAVKNGHQHVLSWVDSL